MSINILPNELINNIIIFNKFTFVIRLRNLSKLFNNVIKQYGINNINCNKLFGKYLNYYHQLSHIYNYSPFIFKNIKQLSINKEVLIASPIIQLIHRFKSLKSITISIIHTNTINNIHQIQKHVGDIIGNIIKSNQIKQIQSIKIEFCPQNRIIHQIDRIIQTISIPAYIQFNNNMDFIYLKYVKFHSKILNISNIKKMTLDCIKLINTNWNNKNKLQNLQSINDLCLIINNETNPNLIKTLLSKNITHLKFRFSPCFKLKLLSKNIILQYFPQTLISSNIKQLFIEKLYDLSLILGLILGQLMRYQKVNYLIFINH